MAKLVEVAQACGLSQVRTYTEWQPLLFRADPSQFEDVSALLEARLLKDVAHVIGVIWRRPGAMNGPQVPAPRAG